MDEGGHSTLVAAVSAHARQLLAAAPLTLAYQAALTDALTLPGNILSERPNMRWARPVWTCCVAAGGHEERAIPSAALVELFMVALDLLDDEEDGETNPLHVALGAARTLNVATGLLLLVQRGLLDGAGAMATDVLLDAGLRACSGQHADLAPPSEQGGALEAALAVAAGKSASLVAAICQLGAMAARADEPAQALCARFGWNLGMVKQLTNDLVALRPTALDKTDRALGRPTLPLTHAALLARAATPCADAGPAILTEAPAQLTWVVAETYRQHALSLIPHLTPDDANRLALTALLDLL